MSVTRDSIQTLLKQRRELRDCLRELRQEISALKDKADTMVAGAKKEPEAATVLEEETAPKVTFEMASEGLVSPPKEAELTADSDALPEDVDEALAIPDPSEIADKARFEKRVLKTVPVRDEPKTIQNPATEPLAKPVPILESDTVSEVEPAPNPDPDPHLGFDPFPEPVTEIDSEKKVLPTPGLKDDAAVSPLGGERQKLYREAVQLARFFLHQPTSSADQKVDALEAAIEAVDNATTQAEQDSAYQKMRFIYRDLVAATYPDYRVSGKSIMDSEGPIRGLFALPFSMSLLILFIMPGLYLFRYFLPDIVGSDLLVETAAYLIYVLAFMWGVAGGLFQRSLRLISAVHAKQYDRCRFRGSGVIGTVAGLLGLLSPPVFQFLGIDETLIVDLAMGGLSFGVGFIWACLFSWIAGVPSTRHT